VHIRLFHSILLRRFFILTALIIPVFTLSAAAEETPTPSPTPVSQVDNVMEALAHPGGQDAIPYVSNEKAQELLDPIWRVTSTTSVCAVSAGSGRV